MKRVLKTLAVFFSAIFLLASCSSSDDEPLGEFDDATGEFVVAMREKVTERQFKQTVDRHGWYEAELHAILENGKYDEKNILDDYVGVEPIKYLFDDDMVVTFYYMTNGFSCDAYQNYNSRYDESTGKVFVNETIAYIILSVSDNEIRAVKTASINDNGCSKTAYRYVILRKMTDGQLQKAKEECWIKYADLAREMTMADLCHKWVLINNSGRDINPNIVSAYERRSNDLHYIQFNPDGTIEGKNSTIPFKGTYEYTLGFDDKNIFPIETLRIIPDKDGGEWPWIFKDFPEVTSVDVLFASYMTLTVDKNRYYSFIRGIEE